MGYAGLQPEDPREIGPYRLLGQLGTGGMGQVFLGMSAGGRPIAVKVIRTELATDPDFRGRFRREVAAAQKVSGLFTALVVDADLDCPMPWLATAYVAGPSLTEAVKGHGPLPARSVLALTAGLAEGLDAIHAAGVVHRDLKPSNVLLAEDGPRVIDFGISEAAEASAVAGANVLIGSPGYMSPEQVLGADVGPASDIFSLGSVLTFAATGTGPFGAGSHAALMYRLVNNPADLDNVPGELRSLVASCLAKHPGDRPTARQLLAEIGALQPAPGWLAESIVNSFIQDPAAANLTETSARPAGAVPLPRSGRPLRRGTGGLGRHRISRPLASACLTGGLVAGSAVAAFALIGANHHTPAAGHLQPQAGAGAVATTPTPASSNPAASPGPSSSSAPSAAARVSPNMYLSPALSRASSTSLAPTPIVSQFSAQPSSSSSSSSSSKPSKPAKSSPPASSPPASSPPASSPPASSPPASSPPASSPPASSPPASSPPASSPPASSPPASSPPASSPPASDPGPTSPAAPST
ncbi:MAG TPA: serine/threonine-protein kinase [Streptosporangiaceae bacterium]